MNIEILNRWQRVALQANYYYAIVIAQATVVTVLFPAALSYFIPCAEFMELEWLFMTSICICAVGLLNMAFAFMPALESALPQSCGKPLQYLLLFALPAGILVYALWLTYSPFSYALFYDHGLLCD